MHVEHVVIVNLAAQVERGEDRDGTESEHAYIGSNPPEANTNSTTYRSEWQPMGYDFNPGKYIYFPPSTFCNYFNCIPTFYAPDDTGDGYVIECQDSTYSQSGSERGACSSHGGVMRPLYAH